MRGQRLFIGLFAALILTLSAGASTVFAQPAVRGGPSADINDMSIFFEELAPYGEWVNMAPHGWVWSPYNVSYDWRPYQDGKWVWTDEYGWTWVSNEPFGWATYHYGRWFFSDDYGWVWVPASDWGPGWVAWREGDGWIGWAALPPDETIHRGVSGGQLHFSYNTIRRHHWNFVEVRQFGQSNLRPHVIRSVRNVGIFDQTHDVTNYRVINNNVVNNSIQVNFIEKRIGRRVPRYAIRDADRGRPGGIVGEVLQLFRPRMSRGTPRRTPDVIWPRRDRDRHDGRDRDRHDRRDRDRHDSRDYSRYEQDRNALQRRLDAEKAALEDRQRRENGRIGKLGISADELRRRQQLERSAFEEQKRRQQKLLQRYQDRDGNGRGGYTKSKDRKFQYKKD